MNPEAYKQVGRRGAFAELSYLVECKSTYPFFETIAAFNVAQAAESYARECKATNPKYEYRVCYVK